MIDMRQIEALIQLGDSGLAETAVTDLDPQSRVELEAYVAARDEAAAA